MKCAKKEVKHMIKNLIQNGWLQIWEHINRSPSYKERMCVVAQLGLDPACPDQDPGAFPAQVFGFSP